MTAQVIVLAEVRAARAGISVRVSVDPYAPLLAAWWMYWLGTKPKARERKSGEVCEFGRQKCLTS